MRERAAERTGRTVSQRRVGVFAPLDALSIYICVRVDVFSVRNAKMTVPWVGPRAELSTPRWNWSKNFD